MNCLESHGVNCPYCGEHFQALIDYSVAEQMYIEDCYICCRPINFEVTVEDGIATVLLRHENE